MKKPKLREPPEFMREEERIAQLEANQKRWDKYLQDCLIAETRMVSRRLWWRVSRAVCCADRAVVPRGDALLQLSRRCRTSRPSSKRRSRASARCVQCVVVRESVLRVLSSNSNR